MARFKIGSKIYNTASLDELSLQDIILFNTQAEQIGLGSKWSDVEDAAADLSEMTEAQADKHPNKMLVIGVTIWATRRCAGEVLTFGEAVDIPIRDLVFLPEPEDKKPGKPKARKGSRVSVVVDGPEPVTSEPTPTTSASKSSTESST